MPSLINEEEALKGTTSMDNCPCCTDNYSDRRCYCPPQCPDYKNRRDVQGND